MKLAKKLPLSICALAILAFNALAQVVPSAPVQNGEGKAGANRAPQGPGLTLTTPDFQDGGVIPSEYTAADPNPKSPELSWTNVPSGTMSFVLIFRDPDVAIRHKTDDILHWLVFNIPTSTNQLPRGLDHTAQLPDGTIQGRNAVGAVGFLAPGAPAAGPDHHYTFELYALDTRLSLGTDATRQQVVDAMQGHILGKAMLVGRFHRPAAPSAQ